MDLNWESVDVNRLWVILIEKIGDDFHRITKYVRGKMVGGYLDWPSKPEVYKQYGDRKKVKLSFHEQVKTLSFDETVRKLIRTCNWSLNFVAKF